MRKTILIVLIILSMTAFGNIMPKSLLIYYGYPSLINHCQNDTTCATKQFVHYDYIILGERLEEQNHPDHNYTKTIISNIHQNSPETKIFGYLNLEQFAHQTESAKKTLCQNWKEMGVDGILFDEFGYDYGVTRADQNKAIEIVHQYGLFVIANGWNPDDLFGTKQNEAPTKLTAGDYYLSESYQYMANNDIEYYIDANAWRSKADVLAFYLQQPPFTGIKVLAITTSKTDEDVITKLDYAWHSALLDGYEAIGWGQSQFSSSGSSKNQAPYYAHPVLINPGNEFLNSVQQDQNNPAIYYRNTYTGKITINTETHTGNFEKTNNERS